MFNKSVVSCWRDIIIKIVVVVVVESALVKISHSIVVVVVVVLTFIVFNNMPVFAGLNIIGFRWWVGFKIGSSFCSSCTVAVVTSSSN